MSVSGKGGFIQFIPGRCFGCGLCIEICPQGVFSEKNGRAAMTAAENCIECGACVYNCAFGAIELMPGSRFSRPDAVPVVPEEEL